MVTPDPPVPQGANPLVSVPLWIQMEGEYILLSGEEQLALACQLVSIYHNGPDCRAPSDDGWDEETVVMETNAALHMTEEESDEGSEVGFE